MTIQEIDNFVRAKCVKANPSVKINHKKQSRWNGKPHEKDYRDITLEDVMMAIEKEYPFFSLECNYGYIRFTGGMKVYWQLGKSYHLQSKETRVEIYEILKI